MENEHGIDSAYETALADNQIDFSERTPSEFSRGLAAQAWCKPKTEKITMIPELAEEFARIIEVYREALMWCGGSADFGQGGKAEVGWKKICEPLLRGEIK